MEKQLIVPTSEIVFAVKKDGSFIINLGEPKDSLAILEGLCKIVDEADKPTLAAFAISWLLASRDIHEAIGKKLEELNTPE